MPPRGKIKAPRRVILLLVGVILKYGGEKREIHLSLQKALVWILIWSF